ncbi:hypothetical protein LAZ67_13002391 [Cordylochernes scorpioides]|uniref:Uncharacterized protein n=1 Tax=Cordylochernes scorpioides TaxID=51811 RepID=A0ABY6L4J2_9ARAC|nr:hypothetical protein LAZ67_13002391 [Cordylochernes scorpioides]
MASSFGMEPAVVLDNGSFSVKLGLAGEEYPRLFVRPCSETGTYMNRGLVTDWERLEKTWNQLVSKCLRLDPADRALVVTDLPLGPPSQRSRLVEVAVESLGFRAVHVTSPAVLTLYNLGRTTGLLLDVGHGSTFCQAVFEGFSLPNVTARSPLGGLDLDDFLHRRLAPRVPFVLSNGGWLRDLECRQRYLFTLQQPTYMFSRRSPGSIAGVAEEIRYIKEKWCYVPRGDAVVGKNWTLPDGKSVPMGELSGLCGEVVMNPMAVIGRDLPGLGELLQDCLRRADIDLRRPLASRVVLCGGTAWLPGLPIRLTRDLGLEARPAVVSSVAAWRGGSILAHSSAAFPAVTRADVAELGPQRALAQRGMLAS